MQVFISHSAGDTGLHGSVCVALDRSGIHRLDASSTLVLGESLADQLCAKIQESDVSVFLATQRSLIFQDFRVVKKNQKGNINAVRTYGLIQSTKRVRSRLSSSETDV